MPINLQIETDREDDGRWIAEIPSLPGVLVYGASRAEAVANVQALAVRVLAARRKDSTILKSTEDFELAISPE